MANIFLDTNVFIDLMEERKNINEQLLRGHMIFLSPLSIHIYAYLYKYKMPNEKLQEIENSLALIPFDQVITNKAIIGPTSDFEDNVQLHSAAAAECDFFLTEDKKLLAMKFFGKTKIAPQL